MMRHFLQNAFVVVSKHFYHIYMCHKTFYVIAFPRYARNSY